MPLLGTQLLVLPRFYSTFITFLEQLRLTFSDDVWAEGTQTPSPDNNHRTNIIKPSRTKQSHHARALSSREENTRRRLVNQKLYGSFTQHKIRKSRSADELETENKFAVSPIKEQETVNFDSKLQIKPMFNKKIAYKVIIQVKHRKKFKIISSMVRSRSTVGLKPCRDIN